MMKLLLVVALAVLAVQQSENAPVGVIVGNLLSLTEISLKLSDIMSGGCVFVPEVCTLRTEIENINKQLEPKVRTLSDLHNENQEMYKKLTNAVYNNKDLVNIQNNIEYLVSGTVNTLSDKSNKLAQLQREFRAGRSSLTGIFNSDVREFTVNPSNVNTASLMYYELKYTYNRVKKDGQFNGFNNFEEVIAAIGKPVIKPLVNPEPLKYTRAYNSITRVSAYLSKPGSKNFLQAMNKFGPLVFSVYGIVASTVFDIKAARDMRDGLRKTRDEMKDMLNTVDPMIATEQQTKNDLASDFSVQRTFFLEILKAVQYSIFINLDADRLTNADADTTVAAQKTTIREMEAVGKSLQQVFTSQRQRAIISIGVQYGDSISRLNERIANVGLPAVPEYLLLRIIASDNPNMSSYDGRDLGRYRG